MCLLSSLNILTRTIACGTPRIGIPVRCIYHWEIPSRNFLAPSILKVNFRYLSSNGDGTDKKLQKLTQAQRLKQTIKDYGTTILVFHITLALASLGIFYIAISNGVDAVKLLKSIGFSESVVSSKIAIEGSTFVIAYAVHKLFAPVRIGITISAAPFIVKYLRSINVLKAPKPKL